MQKTLSAFRFLAIVLFLFSISTTLCAADAKKGAGKKEKPVTWAIIKVNKELKILKTAEVKGFIKDLSQTYKVDMKAWKLSKKEAKKNKESFSDPQPRKPKVKILAKGLKSEAVAEAKKSKIEEAAKKKKGKKKKKKSSEKQP